VRRCVEEADFGVDERRRAVGAAAVALHRDAPIAGRERSERSLLRFAGNPARLDAVDEKVDALGVGLDGVLPRNAHGIVRVARAVCGLAEEEARDGSARQRFAGDFAAGLHDTSAVGGAFAGREESDDLDAMVP
jgi:hypothetical protein